jgi:hypothetical protein
MYLVSNKTFSNVQNSMLFYANAKEIQAKGLPIIGLTFEQMAAQLEPNEVMFVVIDRKLFVSACTVESETHFKELWDSYVRGELKHISFYRIQLANLELRDVYFDY